MNYKLNWIIQTKNIMQLMWWSHTDETYETTAITSRQHEVCNDSLKKMNFNYCGYDLEFNLVRIVKSAIFTSMKKKAKHCANADA